MNRDEILQVLEDDIEVLKKEYDDCSIRIRQDNTDISENSAFHSLESRMTDLRSQIDVRTMCQAFIKYISPIFNDRICNGTIFGCNVDGRNTVCILSPWSNIEFEEKGFMFININSPIGKALLGKNNNDSVSVGGSSITNIKII